MTDHRLPAEARLRRSADFQRVYDRRSSASDGRIVVYVAANSLGHNRLGLSVSSRIGGAVARNRWKRLIREAFRLHREELPPGVDLVVVPRGKAEPALDWLAPALIRLAAKAARSAREKP